MIARLADDPEIYDGASVTLQCVGRRLQEEKTLAVTDRIEAALRGHLHAAEAEPRL